MDRVTRVVQRLITLGDIINNGHIELCDKSKVIGFLHDSLKLIEDLYDDLHIEATCMTCKYGKVKLDDEPCEHCAKTTPKDYTWRGNYETE